MLQACTLLQVVHCVWFGADGFGDMSDFFVCGSDNQYTARLPLRVELRLSFGVGLLHHLGTILPGNFSHSADLYQLVEAAFRIAAQLLNTRRDSRGQSAAVPP